MAAKAYTSVTIADISDAYSAFLSSEAYTFIGNTTGAPAGLSCSTSVSAYCGSEPCDTVTIGNITCPTGISATITNNNSGVPVVTFTTTATISNACEATIPITIDDITLNKKFSFAVAKAGAAGENGQMLYATCSTDAATVSKVATLTSGTLTLKSGSIVTVKFTNKNTASSPTLNVSGTGAKQIRLNGSALTSPAYYWVTGAVVTFVYDGSYWHVADGSSLSKAEEASGKADDAAKVATNYMNFSDDGLVVGNMVSSVLGNNVLIDSNGVYIRNGTVTLASFTADLIELGKNNRSATIDLCNGVAQMKNIGGDDYNRLEMWATNEVKLSTYNSVNLVNMHHTEYSGVDAELASIKIQNNVPWLEENEIEYGYIDIVVRENFNADYEYESSASGDLHPVSATYPIGANFYIAPGFVQAYTGKTSVYYSDSHAGFRIGSGTDENDYDVVLFHGHESEIKFYYSGTTLAGETKDLANKNILGFTFECSHYFNSGTIYGSAMYMRNGTGMGMALSSVNSDNILRINGDTDFTGGVYVGSIFKTRYGIQANNIGNGLAGQFIATSGSKSFIIRNDANSTYFLIGDDSGGNSFNALRPFTLNNSTGAIVVSSLTQSSSEEYKTNIHEYKESALVKIMNAKVYEYNLKADIKVGCDYKHYGFIIERETPKEFVGADKKSVNLYSMIAFLTKAMQEQQEQIETLKQEIKYLKG